MTEATVRQARTEDYEAVASFTRETWPEREKRDYVPEVFHDWVESDGPEQRTVVVEVETADGSDVAGICQARLLGESEAWLQGMRVNPAYRGGGHGLTMTEALFEWARDRGATVARNMVYSWNDGGLGQSVAAGFAPGVALRWATPRPREVSQAGPVDTDPAAAWSYWTRSDARHALSGLAMDPDESWAVSELSRERLRRVADEEAVLTVTGEGTRAMAARIRTSERAVDTNGDGDTDGDESEAGESGNEHGTAAETETVAEYGIAAWADVEAARTLFDAIRRDAAAVGADATRVTIPETPRHVAEAAYVRAETSDWPAFVLEADLTGGE